MAVKRPIRTLREEVGKRQAFGSPAQEVFLNLMRTAAILQGEFQHLFHEHGLSMSLYNALRIIVARGEMGIRVRAIADEMVVRDPDVSRLVDRLEKMRCVRRARCREDRRVVWVRTTDSGRALIRKLHRPVLRLHERQLGHLSAPDLETLNRLLVEARHPA